MQGRVTPANPHGGGERPLKASGSVFDKCLQSNQRQGYRIDS